MIVLLACAKTWMFDWLCFSKFTSCAWIVFLLDWRFYWKVGGKIDWSSFESLIYVIRTLFIKEKRYTLKIFLVFLKTRKTLLLWNSLTSLKIQNTLWMGFVCFCVSRTRQLWAQVWAMSFCFFSLFVHNRWDFPIETFCVCRDFRGYLLSVWCSYLVNELS